MQRRELGARRLGAALASLAALAAVSCGASSAGKEGGRIPRDAKLDGPLGFGPYMIDAPDSTIGDLSPAARSVGVAFHVPKEPVAYGGERYVATVFMKDRRLYSVALRAQPEQCDALLAQMKRDFGPPGRVKKTARGGELHLWRGEKQGAYHQKATLGHCAVEVFAFDRWEDAGSFFAE